MPFAYPIISDASIAITPSVNSNSIAFTTTGTNVNASSDDYGFYWSTDPSLYANVGTPPNDHTVYSNGTWVEKGTSPSPWVHSGLSPGTTYYYILLSSAIYNSDGKRYFTFSAVHSAKTSSLSFYPFPSFNPSY